MTKQDTKTDALLDDLLQDCDSPEDILGEHGLLKGLTKRLVERALAAELTNHLGYAPHARNQTERANTRNGTTPKRVQTEQGPVDLAVPRDRAGTFEPTVVPKRQRRLEGFDDKVLALYAHGLTTREIQSHLEELYGTEVSPTLISTITDAVLDDVRLWQSRPLEAVYPILYFDCLFVKSRHEGAVKTKAVYVALGVNLLGEKELLACGSVQPKGQNSGWGYLLSSANEASRIDLWPVWMGSQACRKPWRPYFLRPRCNSALSIRSGRRCGMSSGKSGEPWPEISGPSMAPRRWKKLRRPWSSLL